MITRDYFESLLGEGAQWLRIGVEAIGALVVGIGAFLALSLYLRSVASGKQANFNAIRLVLARYLALALEFQLGSDILSTAVKPPHGRISAQWEPIAQLAAIAVIRTGLNYFLGREIKEEQDAQQEVTQAQNAGATHLDAPSSGVTGKPSGSSGAFGAHFDLKHGAPEAHPNRNPIMDTTQIKEHMEIVGSDGQHVGIVDHLDGERIKLTHHDSKAQGKHHFLPVSAITKIDEFVTLSISASDAMAQWQTEQK